MNFGDRPKGSFQVILEWVGTGFSIAYFLTPLYQVLASYRKRVESKHIPLFLLLSILINCTLWIGFAIKEGDWISMLVCNSIGLGVNLILLIMHLYLFLEKKLKPFIGYSLFVVNLIVEIFYLMYQIQKYDFIGLTGMCVNVLMYGSPITNIYQLFKTGQYGFLPILTNFIGFLTCIVWIFYGVLQKDYRVIVSNGISCLLVLIQIIFWFYFFYKKLKLKESQVQTDKLESSIKDSIHEISVNDNTD